MAQAIGWVFFFVLIAWLAIWSKMYIQHWGRQKYFQLFFVPRDRRY